MLEELFGSRPPDAVADRLLRTADVAAVFDVSERTVASWAKKGQLRSIKIPGGHWRFPARAVREALATRHDEDGLP